MAGERAGRDAHREASGRSRESHREASERTRERAAPERGERSGRERSGRERGPHEASHGERSGSRERTAEKQRGDRSGRSREAERTSRGADKPNDKSKAGAGSRDAGKQAKTGSSRPEKNVNRRSEKGPAGPSHAGGTKPKDPTQKQTKGIGATAHAGGTKPRDPTQKQTKALNDTFGNRDLLKSPPTDKELLKLHEQLGTTGLQLKSENGRTKVTFKDETGVDRAWDSGGTVSVHEFELGKLRPLDVPPPRGGSATKAPAKATTKQPSLGPTAKPNEKQPPKQGDTLRGTPAQRDPRNADRPVRQTAPNPHCPPVTYPPGFSPADTAKIGEQKAQEYAWNPIGKYWWFYKAVTGDGPLDFKAHFDPTTYEPAGNHNYGVLGAALGIPDETLKSAAGAYQILDAAVTAGKNLWREKPRRVVYDVSWGLPFVGRSRGDDPRDQLQIECGIEDYRNIYQDRTSQSKQR